MHTRALQTSSYGDFATGFEDAGGGTEALFVEPGIAHAVAIAMDIKSGSRGVGAVCSMRTERVDNGAEFAVVQFAATRHCPPFGLLG